jgi:hypothetical protein
MNRSFALLRALSITAPLAARLTASAPSEPVPNTNLLPNPDLEGRATGVLPAHWAPLTIGPKAQFTIDRRVRHSGQQSVRCALETDDA